MAIEIEPSPYHCPVHPSVDLTDLVEQQLDLEIPVSYRPGIARPARVSRPFLVLVQCPGVDAASSHKQPCTGTFRAG